MISDFQLALAGAAAVLVVGVVAYNRWQESKYKRRAERAFATDHPDVLIEHPPRTGSTDKFERVEPALGAGLSAGFGSAPSAGRASLGTAASSPHDDDGFDDISPITIPAADVYASSLPPAGTSPAAARIGTGTSTSTNTNTNNAATSESVQARVAPVAASGTFPANYPASIPANYRTGGQASTSSAVTTVPNVPALNAEIDSLALILADTPIPPERYQAVVSQSRHLGKGVQWEGLVGGLWKPIGAESTESYRELRAGMQLADRKGATDAMMLKAFNDMVVQFSSSVNAVSQREDIDTALQRAQIVDLFCADTDIEIAVNVLGKNGGTFAVTKVRGLAESKGMLPTASGEYVQQDEHGHMLFTLRNMDPAEPPGIKRSTGYLTGLTFAIDVPRTAHGAKVFEQMFQVAAQFADVLQGEVVDDNRRALTSHGRKVITDTIVDIVVLMENKGVAPGGLTALRLYA
jgi:ZipA, C-terminal FtsZ-binding domain